MELNFDNGFYGEHLEAWTSLPEWWNATDNEFDDYGIYFNAYLNDKPDGGCYYDCFVELEYETCYVHRTWELARFDAEDEDEAMRLLQVAADALYGKE